MADLKKSVSPEHLRVARIEVTNDAELRALFQQTGVENRSEEWLTDNLAVRLSARWGGRDFETASEVAAILAHEYFDHPDKPLALVDAQGQVVQRFGEEDIYQPVPVARESGAMAQPLPRLRPEIEGELVTRLHNREREVAGLAVMASRVGQTALQREDGDRRLDFLTGAGRERILEELPGTLRERLFGAWRGDRAAQRPEGSLALELLARVQDRPLERAMAEVFDQPVRMMISLRDLQSANLRVDVAGRIVDMILGDWTRTVGTLCMAYMNSRAVATEPLEELVRWPCRAWVAPAEIAVRVRRLAPERRVIAVPVWGPLVQVMAQTVTVVPDFDRLDIQRVEYNDRWAINVTAPLRVWWEDHTPLAAFVIDRPDPEVYGELLR